MKYFSTFSGIGGFELGIEQTHDYLYKETSSEGDKILQRLQPLSDGESRTPWRGERPTCVGYSEIDKYAVEIYQKHFPEHKNYGDITKINTDELPDFDLLVGGFPCQAFSIAGKRRGFEDTRGTLFFELARIAKAKEPMFLLLENVKGLVSHNGGKTLEVILETLQGLGYYVNYEIRNSKDYGVPQNRERIFFLCSHIRGITSVGQSEKITYYDGIIRDWLFQLYLNNLAEVKKLQGHVSKDSVIGYLIWKEIREKLLNQDIEENISVGTLPMEENLYLLQVEGAWRNIDLWLKGRLGENSEAQRSSIISTAISSIIESKTYTFSMMLEVIVLATVLLRDSQKNLWNEVLSNLIVVQEDTKYERINNEDEEIVITESGTAHIKSELQDFSDNFIVGHLRGEPRPKVFPFGEDGGISNSELQKPVQRKIQTNGQGGVESDTNSEILETGENRPLHSGQQQNMKIRRLTPTECERLQGFPDGWTEGISDSQRYKCLGNAVTVNVVEHIMERLITT